MDRSTDRLRQPTPRPHSSVPALRAAVTLSRVVGSLALILSALIALSLAAPTINAAEGGVEAGGRLVVVVRDGSDDPASPGGRSGPSVTPPPTDVSIGPGPAFPLLPGWGWVVLGLICFCVVLGLVWPEDRDRF
jgi:hypothetical protein